MDEDLTNGNQHTPDAGSERKAGITSEPEQAEILETKEGVQKGVQIQKTVVLPGEKPDKGLPGTVDDKSLPDTASAPSDDSADESQLKKEGEEPVPVSQEDILKKLDAISGELKTLDERVGTIETGMKPYWDRKNITPETEPDFFALPWYQKFADERSNYVPRLFAFKLVVPFVIATIGVLSLYFFTMALYDKDIFIGLGEAMVIYFVPPLGLEGAMPIALTSDVPIYLIVIAITFIDFCVGLFLIWNFDLSKEIPLLGWAIRKFEGKTTGILEKNKWLTTLATVGVALWVMLPFQGSGAFGAALIGKALGLDPYRVLVAVVIGSFFGALLVALIVDGIINLSGFGA